MALFVQLVPDLSGRKAKMVIDDEDDRKRVRSLAMKAFRDEQRTTYIRGDRTVPSGDDAWRQHRKTARRCAKSSSKPVQQDNTSDPVEGDSDGKEQQPILTTPCITDMVQSTHMYRMALTQNFCDGYFPASAQTDSSLPTILSHWTSPMSPAMETGNDALALLHLGGAIGDERVSLEGHRKYLHTLHMVRHDIQQDAGHHSFEGLFAAAQDLLNCEMYKSVSSGFSAWSKHIAGINAIIGTSGFRKMNPIFNAFLFAQFRHASLMYALVQRSAVTLCRSSWSTGCDHPEPGSTALLTRLGLTLPSLLELTDQVSEPGTERKDLQSALDRLSDLEKNLSQWSKDFRKAHSKTSPTHQPPHFVLLALAFQQSLLLIVFEAMWMLKKNESSQALADGCAENLTKHVPLLAATTAGDVGKAMAARGPIYFASRWYQQSKNSKALEQVLTLEAQFRDTFVYLDWDALLPFSFLALLWIS